MSGGEQCWVTAAARAGAGLATAALLLAAPPALAREDLFGPARVVDGDTIVVGSTRVRLFGIDAPETHQSCSAKGGEAAYECGVAAKAALERKIGAAPVRCETKRKDMYGRTVAICSLDSRFPGGAAEDLNGWMVSEGQAVAYRRYSKKYAPLEDAARAAGKGIWSGQFQEPEAWRKEHPRGKARGDAVTQKAAAAAVAAAALPPAPPLVLPVPLGPGGCSIKGNITAKGDRVYHSPGGRSYEATKINTAAGERWFCSEAEAEAAGWRPTKY